MPDEKRIKTLAHIPSLYSDMQKRLERDQMAREVHVQLMEELPSNEKVEVSRLEIKQYKEEMVKLHNILLDHQKHITMQNNIIAKLTLELKQK